MQTAAALINRASDGSIIVRDAETGALEQVSPDAVLNIDEPLNPSDEKNDSGGGYHSTVRTGSIRQD